MAMEIAPRIDAIRSTKVDDPYITDQLRRAVDAFQKLPLGNSLPEMLELQHELEDVQTLLAFEPPARALSPIAYDSKTKLRSRE